MSVISSIESAVNAIEKLTNHFLQDKYGPRKGSKDGSGAAEAIQLLSEKKIVKDIVVTQGVKANVKLIQTADKLVGTIIDLKV